MKKLILSLVLMAGFTFGQVDPTKIPAGWQQVTISGLPAVIPTLATAMRYNLDATENVSVQLLANEGQGSPSLVIDGIKSLAASLCKESQMQALGCSDIPGTIAPFVAEAQIVFNLVPASQWDPRTFTINLPVNAAGYIKPPTPPTPPPSTVRVGACYVFGPTSVCNPGPGSNLNNTKNGDLVVGPDGRTYVAVVGSGMMGPSLYFQPFTSSLEKPKVAAPVKSAVKK